MITQERLKEVLHYDPRTGHFTWIGKASRNTVVGSVAGSINKAGYRQIQVDKKLHLAHHLAFLYVEGFKPKVIDHKDRVRDNNAWCNIRLATRSQNSCNIGITARNTSGFKGVYLDSVRNKWAAEIKVSGKKHHIGRFDNIEDAAEAVRVKRAELHKEFANNG